MTVKQLTIEIHGNMPIEMELSIREFVVKQYQKYQSELLPLEDLDQPSKDSKLIMGFYVDGHIDHAKPRQCQSANFIYDSGDLKKELEKIEELKKYHNIS